MCLPHRLIIAVDDAFGQRRDWRWFPWWRARTWKNMSVFLFFDRTTCPYTRYFKIPIYLWNLGIGLGYCIVEHIIASAWDTIEAELASSNTVTAARHLRPEQRYPGVKCPTESDMGEKPFFFPCPCSFDSVTNFYKAHQGPSLIVAPPQLLVIIYTPF